MNHISKASVVADVSLTVGLVGRAFADYHDFVGDRRRRGVWVVVPIAVSFAAVYGEDDKADEDQCCDDDAGDGGGGESGVMVVVVAGGGEGGTVACEVAAVIIAVLLVAVGIVAHEYWNYL